MSEAGRPTAVARGRPLVSHGPPDLGTDDSPAGAACRNVSHLFSVHPSDPGSVIRRMFALLATTMLKFHAPAGQSDLEREVDSIMGDSESPRPCFIWQCCCASAHTREEGTRGKRRNVLELGQGQWRRCCQTQQWLAAASSGWRREHAVLSAHTILACSRPDPLRFPSWAVASGSSPSMRTSIGEANDRSVTMKYNVQGMLA